MNVNDLKTLERFEVWLSTPEGRYKFLSRVILFGLIMIGCLFVGWLIGDAPGYVIAYPVIPLIWLELLRRKQLRQIKDQLIR